MARITTDHLEIFLEYLNYYKFKGNTYRNGERARPENCPLSGLFFKYYYNKGAINYDAAAKVRLPKFINKEIVRLEVDEVVRLLNEVEAGDTLTLKQKYYHDITKLRDLAMMSLFLGTEFV